MTRPARRRAGPAGRSRNARRSPRCRHPRSRPDRLPATRARATSHRPCRAPDRTRAAARPPGGRPPPPRARSARCRRRRRRRRPRPHRSRRRRAARIARARPAPRWRRTRARAGRPRRSAPGAPAQPRSARRGRRRGARRGAVPGRRLERPAEGQRSQASALLSQPVAKERQTEPWSAMLDAGRADGRLVREAREGPGGARLAEPPAELHPQVREALERIGIERLYDHQALAINSAWAAPTIVTTGTASGKSMCFNLPTLDVLCRDARARALYLYPTKALAQDQARALASFGLTRRVRPAIYDGDTPREARPQIRRSANVVLTNPDMLHVGILPNHGAWGNLFANLALVIIDEAHVYRGVFGSHVANVLRRLRRVAAAYGTEPRFLLASATIANPRELAERLTGLEGVHVIERDGSPTPARRIALWNPPLTDEALGKRRSAFGEAPELPGELARQGARARPAARPPRRRPSGSARHRKSTRLNSSHVEI